MDYWGQKLLDYIICVGENVSDDTMKRIETQKLGRFKELHLISTSLTKLTNNMLKYADFKYIFIQNNSKLEEIKSKTFFSSQTNWAIIESNKNLVNFDLFEFK